MHGGGFIAAWPDAGSGAAGRQVDGIIATGKRVDRHLPVDLLNLGVPVVYAFIQPDPGAVAFVSDDAEGAQLAVEHLVKHGRRRIVHISGPIGFSVARTCARPVGTA